MPTPQILTVALVTALTLLLPTFAHSRAGGDAGRPHLMDMPAQESGPHARHIHPAVIPVDAVALLPRTGWTASADSQEFGGENGAVAHVLDGDVNSIWHTKYSGGADPLPHTLTIDMKTPTTVGLLQYLPRPGPNVNGRIGQYRINVSTDGVNWGNPVNTGTFADDATEKTATFIAPISARYVRLTELTEAGNRGPWCSVAEINLGAGTTTAPPTTPPAAVG